jgi:hypothetical protein
MPERNTVIRSEDPPVERTEPDRLLAPVDGAIGFAGDSQWMLAGHFLRKPISAEIWATVQERSRAALQTGERVMVGLTRRQFGLAGTTA